MTRYCLNDFEVRMSLLGSDWSSETGPRSPSTPKTSLATRNLIRIGKTSLGRDDPPGDRQAKNVESVGFGKVHHLVGAIAAAVTGEGRVDGGEGAGTLSELFSTAKLVSWMKKADVHRHHSQNRIQRY